MREHPGRLTEKEIALMVKSELYRVVMTFECDTGRVVNESRARTKEQAMRLFEWHISFGTVTPHSHVKVRVMTDREYRKLAGEGHWARRSVVEGPAL